MAVPDDFDFEQMMEEQAEAEREAAYDAPTKQQSSSASSTAAAALGAMASDVPDEHKKDFIEWQKKKMMEKMAADRVSAAVKKAMADRERKMDAKLERMDEIMHEMMKKKDGRYGEDEMDSDDDDVRGGEDVMSKLREKRKKDLFSKQSKRSQWIRNGHGTIQTIKDQKDWFSAMKSTDLVIALFNNPTNKWGKMLREHLVKVAIKHLECKFIDMDVNDAPFLCDRLDITVTPTLVCCKKGKVDRKLIGLDWVAPDGKIDTLKLEQRLFEYGFFEDTTLANTPAMGSSSVAKGGIRSARGSSSFQSDVLDEDESSELDLDD